MEMLRSIGNSQSAARWVAGTPAMTIARLPRAAGSAVRSQQCKSNFVVWVKPFAQPNTIRHGPSRWVAHVQGLTLHVTPSRPKEARRRALRKLNRGQ